MFGFECKLINLKYDFNETYYFSNGGVKKNKKLNSSDNETIDNSVNIENENMIKAFKRSSMKIVSEVRKRREYLKPSVKKKLKSEAARRRKSKNFRNFRNSEI